VRIGIVGATGRIGTSLVEAVLASPGIELAAAIVSPDSRLVGMPVAGGGIEYRAADAAMKSHCDAMIDFSTPDASLALQEMCGTKAIPFVIGTTGFDERQRARLQAHARFRPILIGTNFAVGFEAFASAARAIAGAMPGAQATVTETYHLRRKAEPSGTSLKLAREVRESRARAAGVDPGETRILVRREGDAAGVTELRFDHGGAELALTYRVHTVAAYAQGALAAARWLVESAAGPGCYDPDCFAQ
jgi:4-hydroxy-tetrahydrodipicolinate reductase